eukprot:TRINITY_DN3195_c0_g1_i10.p1 TRINITY_DN3195_c0_g1~~TRINITY_DN3195_c0_g1_i10.p1  ORF type:complete len:188 (+),score=-16.93 TRINITY_DN3195_c0_g1_i10:1213-1776(+)
MIKHVSIIYQHLPELQKYSTIGCRLKVQHSQFSIIKIRLYYILLLEIKICLFPRILLLVSGEQYIIPLVNLQNQIFCSLSTLSYSKKCTDCDQKVKFSQAQSKKKVLFYSCNAILPIYTHITTQFELKFKVQKLQTKKPWSCFFSPQNHNQFRNFTYIIFPYNKEFLTLSHTTNSPTLSFLTFVKNI